MLAMRNEIVRKITKTNSELQDLKDLLVDFYKRRAKLIEQVQIIDSQIEFFESRRDEYIKLLDVEMKESSSDVRVEDEIIGSLVNFNEDVLNTYTHFPTDESIENKIIFIMETLLDKATLIKVIQAEYNVLNQTSYNITHKIRELKRKQRIVAIRYNNINQYTYWGTSKMLNEYKTDFAVKYKPKELIGKIWKAELL